MENVRTLNDLNNNQIIENSQITHILKLRGQHVSDKSPLDKAVEEIQKYQENNTSSNMRDDFPEIYPNNTKNENVNEITIFDLIKKIYNKIVNNNIEVSEEEITSIVEELNKDTSSDLLNDEVKDILQKVTNNIKKEIISNDEIKPLGNFGDMTLNNIINKTVNSEYTNIILNTEISLRPFNIIPASLIYRSIMKLYLNHCDTKKDILNAVHLTQGERIKLLRLRNAHIVTTAVIIAPLTTILLLKFAHINLLDIFNLKFNIENSNINNLSTKDTVTQLGLIFTIIALKKNNPNWFRFIILFFLFLIFCGACLKYNLICFAPLATLGIDSQLALKLFYFFIDNFNIKYFIFFCILFLVFSLTLASIGLYLLLNTKNKDINEYPKLAKIASLNFYFKDLIEASFIIKKDSYINKKKMIKYNIIQISLYFFAILVLIYFIL